jgi:hypothetical protein
MSLYRNIYVKRWNSTSWVAVGGSLNVDVNASAYTPGLDIDNGTPYVAMARGRWRN